MQGIDVSKWQGKIDWKTVAASGKVDFAILRATHGVTSVDEFFEANYAAARLAGIPIGAYYYPYYGDKGKFFAGLDNFLKHCKGKTFELPLFLDLEEEQKKYNPPLGAVDKKILTDWAIETCEKIRAAGFRPGIYANAYWMRKKIDMSRIPADVCIWCADTSGPIDYTGRVDVHQYDFYGEVPGIAGKGVDLNRSYCSDDYLLGRTIFSGHIQNLGWQDGEQTIGTVGQSLRLEAVKIDLPGIEYRAHVQGLGWLDWVASGQVAGTTGESRRMEAIQIIGPVMYRAHVQDIGWMSWVKSGETAGTTGQSKRLEAIEIKML